MDPSEKLATVTYLSERIAAVAAVPPEEAPRRRERRSAPDDGFDEISTVAMRSLTRRGMSSAELRTALLQKEFDAADVEREIERLESVGLLDDLQLAEVLIRTLRERKGLGRVALKAELGRRRLDPDAVAAALEHLEDDDRDLALDLARRRAAQLRSYDRETANRRLVSFLQRKGYSSGVAARAAQLALSPHPSSGGPRFE